MNWRRGLVLAGINVLAALPMICMLAARDAHDLADLMQSSVTKETLSITSSGELSTGGARTDQVQEEQAVSFGPCGLWEHYPVQDYVVQLGNLPAFVVSQWRAACPPRWSIARMLGVNDAGLLSESNFEAMRRVDAALCILIAIQWLLIGGFPLIRARRWWAEPGALITTWSAIGSSIALIPVAEELGQLPALIAFFGWIWWFGLLFWKLAHLAWQSTLGGLRRLSN